MISNDGDDGYPGSLSIAAKLSLSPISGELRVEYSGMSTKKTPIDISNNILLNLAGHNKGIRCGKTVSKPYKKKITFYS